MVSLSYGRYFLVTYRQTNFLTNTTSIVEPLFFPTPRLFFLDRRVSLTHTLTPTPRLCIVRLGEKITVRANKNAAAVVYTLAHILSTRVRV